MSSFDRRCVDLFDIVSNAVRDLNEFWCWGGRGVILCATFVRPPRPILAWCRFAAVGGVIGMIRIARRVPIYVSTNPRWDIRRDKAETWARVPARTLAVRVRAILRLNARGLLRRCAMPIVYLASSRDSVVPRANAEELAHHAPSSRLVVIDGPHMPLHTNPKAAAAAVCRTLAGA